MRAIDLETKVITAVDQIRAGKSVEHDFIECKRDWPKENKARQLAASLNRAGGDPVIYIIGIDEKTGEVFDVLSTEVSDWWGQITPKFDQTPPEIVRHVSVPVGDAGEQVMAVAFASDRAPYMVKTGLPNPSLEVPMREGTSTRTARRDELLRLLIPTVTVPRAVVLEAGLTIEDSGVAPVTLNSGPNPKRDLYSFGSVRIYVEHNGRDLVSFPAHGMSGRVSVSGHSFPLRVRQTTEGTSLAGSRDPLAVRANYDGVTVNGPGAVSVDVELLEFDSDDVLWFEMGESVQIELELDVLHSVRPLTVDVALQRVEDDWDSYDSERQHQTTVGQWTFNHPGRRMHEQS
jgi:hypothetical protein